MYCNYNNSDRIVTGEELLPNKIYKLITVHSTNSFSTVSGNSPT